MKTEKIQHNYGIDLLRIAAMLMIISHHFSVHSGINTDADSAAELVMAIMALGGKTGINIFVLITGYFSSGKIRREKILELIGSTTFYSVLLTLLAIVFGSVTRSKKLLLKAAVPWLLGGNYWFITTYLVLYITAPIFNKVIELIPQRTYKRYLLLSTIFLSILPTVLGKFIETNDFGYNSLTWFVYLYFLGAYLSKYGLPIKYNRLTYVWMGLMILQIAACCIVVKGQTTYIGRQILACVTDYNANAVFPLAIAIAMLLSFKNLMIRKGKMILQIVGSSTLGIYLFHDNMNFRGWMWEKVYQFASGNGTFSFAISAVLSVIIVFTIGCAVEITREFAFNYIHRKIEKRRE